MFLNNNNKKSYSTRKISPEFARNKFWLLLTDEHTEQSQISGLVSLLRCRAKCSPVFSLNRDLAG